MTESLPKESYSYFEWHLNQPRGIYGYLYRKIHSPSGEKFTSRSRWWLIGCAVVGLGISLSLTHFVLHAGDWPKEYRGLASIPMFLALFTVTIGLHYLLLPIIGWMANESGDIDEEEFRVIKRRRISGSFVIKGKGLLHEEKDE